MIRNHSYSFLTIYFFFCLHPFLNTFASPTRSLCRRDQRGALLEVQKEFHVPTRISWNKSVDCCSWEGVTCDAILGEVISLNLVSYITDNTSFKFSSGLFKLQHLHHLVLSSCNLQGEIPSSIGNLSHLTYLDLSNNQLVGEVPSSIGKLSHLTYLSLYNNHLVGEVPSSIGNLNQLESMILWENDLRGNIPTSFANLTKLSGLYLSDNQFTGGDIILANLTSLIFIDLSSNHFKSLISADLSRLHKLEAFTGNDNSFVGPFPSSLLMISSLFEIDLSQNQFKGPIDFGNTSSSSKLQVLKVGDNNFYGLIPESISKLCNLLFLDLSHNSFGGRFPRTLSKLVKLDYLDLSYNKLKGQVPHLLEFSNLGSIQLSHNSFTSFGNLVEVIDEASLVVLNLGSNSLQGSIPHWICKLRWLTRLDLSSNHITGSVPGCLTYLEEIILRNNSLSGFQPDLCINGTQLRTLDVSRNNLVGKFPKSLINCKDLEFLNFRGNKIKDTFPFWLGSMRLLVVLVLRSNAFYGSIYNPSAYSGLPSIRIIDIADNKFVGSLPQDYFANWTDMSKVWIDDGFSRSPDYVRRVFYSSGDSVDLVYKGVDTNFTRVFGAFKAIDFSGNQFCGNIPGSIGLLSELRLLNLSGNTFTGNIPSSLENISNLETLDLSRNNLSGIIPRGLGNLSFLSNINFSHNNLQGLVPQSTQFGSQKCSSFIDNNGLYGLEKICGKDHVPVRSPQQPKESLSKSEEPILNWIAAAIAFGPGLFGGLVVGHIFTSYKHEWFIARQIHHSTVLLLG